MEQQLLAHIYDRPDDDDARLIYADWLVARGDPKGEFIHAQCRSAGATWRRPGRWLTLPESELAALQQELLKKHEKQWVGPLYGRIQPVWRRGFIDSIACTGVQFVELLEPMVACAPLAHFDVSKVTSGHCDLMGMALAMRGVRRLSLAMPKVTARSFKFLASPQLSSLRRLSLDLIAGNRGVEILGQVDSLTALEHLDLSSHSGRQRIGQRYTPLHEGQLERITAGRLFAKLRSFRLDHHTGLEACAVELLSRGSALEELSVEGCQLSDDCLAGLLRSPGLRGLRSVRLRGNEVGPATLGVLLGQDAPPTLTALTADLNDASHHEALAQRYRFGPPWCSGM